MYNAIELSTMMEITYNLHFSIWWTLTMYDYKASELFLERITPWIFNCISFKFKYAQLTEDYAIIQHGHQSRYILNPHQ